MSITRETQNPEEVANKALAASGFLDGQHRRDVASFIVSEFRAAGLLGGDPTEGQIERAEGIYREHVTGYSMRDGGYTYTCRCGETWSGENASTQANHHRMRLALAAAAGVVPRESSEDEVHSDPWPACEGCPEMGEEDERCPRHGLNHYGLWVEIDRLRNLTAPSSLEAGER